MFPSTVILEDERQAEEDIIFYFEIFLQSK